VPGTGNFSVYFPEEVSMVWKENACFHFGSFSTFFMIQTPVHLVLSPEKKQQDAKYIQEKNNQEPAKLGGIIIKSAVGNGYKTNGPDDDHKDKQQQRQPFR
jgi:hypothetical protein